MRTIPYLTALLVCIPVAGYGQGVVPSPPIPGKPATLADGLRATFVAQTRSDFPASKLIGTTIRNKAEETVGSVTDVVFGEDKAVKAFVVSVGGFLGIASKQVAVAPETLVLSRDGQDALVAVIDTDKDQLRAAPEYVYLGSKPAN